jgi:hypothetical protein
LRTLKIYDYPILCIFSFYLSVPFSSHSSFSVLVFTNSFTFGPSCLSLLSKNAFSLTVLPSVYIFLSVCLSVFVSFPSDRDLPTKVGHKIKTNIPGAHKKNLQQKKIKKRKNNFYGLLFFFFIITHSFIIPRLWGCSKSSIAKIFIFKKYF